MFCIWMSEIAREAEVCLAFFTFNLDGAFLLGFPEIDKLYH